MAETPSNGTNFPWYGGRLTDEVTELDLHDLLLERGTSGLRRSAGFIREEPLTELVGQAGIRKYTEMRNNSAVIAACLFAFEMLLRNVPWQIQPAEDSAEAQRYADVVDGMLFQDLDEPWSLLLSEILSFLPYGFAYMEMVFKRRLGQDPPPFPDGTPALPSRYNDGYLGLGKLSQRSQETVLRWEFSSTGALLGMHQLDPYAGRQAFLPYPKCLLFRPTSYKQNPEGRSILRSSYRAYYLLTHIENTEGIGIERDLAGVPLMQVPPQWMSATASAEEQGQLEMCKRIVRNLRNDEQAGIVLPSIYDQAGNKLLSLELMNSGGRRAFDTKAIIERYELRIAQSLLCDVIFLGHEAVGSFALASSKTTTLAMALGGFLQVICDEINRRCLPLLWRLNAFPEELIPTLAHGDIESLDLKELAQFISAYAGVPAFDLSDVENHVRELAGFPERQTPASEAEGQP